MQNLNAFWRKQSIKSHCAAQRWAFVKLHESLFVLAEDVVLIRSSACLSDLGQAIFYTTTCLLPFLSDDILSTLPYTMISTLATFPPFLHKDIIEYLSTSFLPMAICEYIWLHKCHLQSQYLSDHTVLNVLYLRSSWIMHFAVSKCVLCCSGFDSKRGWRSGVCQSVRLLHADDRHAVHFKSRYRLSQCSISGQSDFWALNVVNVPLLVFSVPLSASGVSHEIQAGSVEGMDWFFMSFLRSLQKHFPLTHRSLCF